MSEIRCAPGDQGGRAPQLLRERILQHKIGTREQIESRWSIGGPEAGEWFELVLLVLLRDYGAVLFSAEKVRNLRSNDGLILSDEDKMASGWVAGKGGRYVKPQYVATHKDMGIDLLFRTMGGSFAAIQAKWYAPKARIPWKDLRGFVGESTPEQGVSHRFVMAPGHCSLDPVGTKRASMDVVRFVPLTVELVVECCVAVMERREPPRFDMDPFISGVAQNADTGAGTSVDIRAGANMPNVCDTRRPKPEAKAEAKAEAEVTQPVVPAVQSHKKAFTKCVVPQFIAEWAGMTGTRINVDNVLTNDNMFRVETKPLIFQPDVYFFPAGTDGVLHYHGGLDDIKHAFIITTTGCLFSSELVKHCMKRGWKIRSIDKKPSWRLW